MPRLLNCSATHTAYYNDYVTKPPWLKCCVSFSARWRITPHAFVQSVPPVCRGACQTHRRNRLHEGVGAILQRDEKLTQHFSRAALSRDSTLCHRNHDKDQHLLNTKMYTIRYERRNMLIMTECVNRMMQK